MNTISLDELLVEQVSKEGMSELFGGDGTGGVSVNLGKDCNAINQGSSCSVINNSTLFTCSVINNLNVTCSLINDVPSCSLINTDPLCKKTT